VSVDAGVPATAEVVDGAGAGSGGVDAVDVGSPSPSRSGWMPRGTWRPSCFRKSGPDSSDLTWSDFNGASRAFA
jgi:hypothetical protein